MAQLGSVDEACMYGRGVNSKVPTHDNADSKLTIAVLVKDLEGFPDLLLGVGILHFASHHGQELGCDGDTTLLERCMRELRRRGVGTHGSQWFHCRQRRLR